MKITHDLIERNQALLIVLVVLTVAVGGLVEIVPLSFQKSVTEPVAGLKPYTALQLAGRDIYQREGCFNCHSQMIRPLRAETLRYGHYSTAGEFVYDHPFLWGSRRIGPDLARQAGKYPDLWHVRHMEDPRSITAKSVMPGYPALLTSRLDFTAIQSRVDAMAMLGVPYGDAVTRAPEMAQAQAKEVAAKIAEAAAAVRDKTEVEALVSYLQRLGTDIRKPAGVAAR